LLYCATCGAFLFRDEHVIVVVVGGGDTAMEDALVLSTTSKTVTIVHRGGSFRASVILAGRVMNHPSIYIKWNHTVEQIHGKMISVDDDEVRMT
jgi:thioredoxin reductase (NADPH)